MEMLDDVARDAMSVKEQNGNAREDNNSVYIKVKLLQHTLEDFWI
jgi:hypothetical protein